jgi:hypothetical protein
MESAEFVSSTIRGRGNQLEVSHGGDENLIVQFQVEPVLQGAESEKAGRPIYKDTAMVWIRFPGDRTREVYTRAKAEHQMRFPRQWAQFQQKVSQGHVGTPIEEWGPISKSHALTLKGSNVHTVEQLASVTDANLHSLGHGARPLRDKAIAWLKAASDGAETNRLAAENQQLRDDLAALKEQVAELAAKRKPGRPKADEQE